MSTGTTAPRRCVYRSMRDARVRGSLGWRSSLAWSLTTPDFAFSRKAFVRVHDGSKPVGVAALIRMRLETRKTHERRGGGERVSDARASKAPNAPNASQNESGWVRTM